MFARDLAGDVFHTHSCYARGGEKGIGTYMLLDLTPKGRNETGPNFALTDWVRHHHRYHAAGHVDSSGRYKAATAANPCCHADDGPGSTA